MQKLIYVLLNTILTLALAVVIFAAGVPPHEAKTNVAGWYSLTTDRDAPPWLVAPEADRAVLVGGVLIFAVSCLFIRLLKPKAVGDQPDRRTLRGRLQSYRTRPARRFVDSYVTPAVGGLHQISQLVTGALLRHEKTDLNHYAPLLQNFVFAQHATAWSSLGRALNGSEFAGPKEVRRRIARHHEAYQGARSWITQGAELAGLELAGNVAFRDWLIHDREYLDEFRRIRKLEPHAEFVDGFIGFGEGVTARLENVVRPVHPARNLAR